MACSATQKRNPVLCLLPACQAVLGHVKCVWVYNKLVLFSCPCRSCLGFPPPSLELHCLVAASSKLPSLAGSPPVRMLPMSVPAAAAGVSLLLSNQRRSVCLSPTSSLYSLFSPVSASLMEHEQNDKRGQKVACKIENREALGG